MNPKEEEVHDDDDDEEEEEDQDYDPTEDQDKDSDTDEQPLGGAETSITGIPPILSQTKQQAVEKAFLDLFPNHSAQRIENIVPPKQSRNSSSTLQKQTKILSDIFGGSKHVVAQLLHRQNHPASNIHTTTAIRKEKQVDGIIATEEGSKKPIVQKKRNHTETVEDDPTPTNAIIKKNKMMTTSSGLDSILSKMDAPDKVSTLTKTSIDWEQFKDEQDLEDELAKKAQGKDAYLLKQEFLQRVDLRRFEHEKAERDKKRASTTSASG